MGTRAAAAVFVCFSDALNSSSYVPISALCSRNRTQNIGLVSFYTKPIFHACVTRIAKISRYVTAIQGSMGIRAGQPKKGMKFPEALAPPLLRIRT